MSATKITPATEAAIGFAERLDERLFSIGVDAEDYRITTPNGCKVNLTIGFPSDSTAFKANLYVLAMTGGYISGKVPINTNVTEKKKYWQLLDALTAAGFRNNLDKPDAPEYFMIPVSNEGVVKQVRINIIKIKTDVLNESGFVKFAQLVQVIYGFDGLELQKPASSTVMRRVYSAPVVAVMPAHSVPPPTSAEWVPLPSQQKQQQRLAAPVAILFQAHAQAHSQAPVDISAEIETLRKKLGELERAKKIADFEAKQKAEREEFEKSL